MSQLWMDIQPSLWVVMSLYSTAYDLPSHRVLVGLMILVMSSLKWAHLAWRLVARYTGSTADC